MSSGSQRLNRHTLLYRTADLTVSRFDHPAHEVHQDPDREVADHWSIAFVRSGAFDIAIEGERRRRLVQGSVFIPRPGLAFQCGHSGACPDDVCLSVRLDPGAVVGWEHGWARSGWAARRVATPRLAYVQVRLTGAVDQADTFEMERWALAGVAALGADSMDRGARGAYAASADDLAAVTATCRAIEADASRRCTIGDRAREVGRSSTRLTHAFRRYLGLSPHQYVVRWRLALAAALLNDGDSVSDACWRSGFENLSHFCRTFQRAFGMRASSWKRLPLHESRRKVQALLGAGR